MDIQRCVKCNVRPAVVFITRLDNGKSVNEGLCLVCARELGIKPVDDILKKMGMSEEDISNMSEEIDGIINANPDNLPEAAEDNGGAPAIDFKKLFSGFGLPPIGGKTNPQKQKNPASSKDDFKKTLAMYCTNLNEKARSGKVDRIVGRERELMRVIQILCRRQKNNPCLIGEPGVGKTAIAEALAQRIVDGDVPEPLRESEIWLLDLTALVAGTQFRGQFESRILGLLKEVKRAGNIILMIDEVHNIVGAGDSEGSMSAANILKPALSRGELRVIGATTLKEYRKYIEKDSALERRFQPVIVEEPSIEETVNVLIGIKKYYEQYHGIKISNEIARSAAVLSERYITDRYLPDKAIDLIDEACSKVALASVELNEKKQNDKKLLEIEKNRAELEAKIELPEGQTEENYKALADLKVEALKIETRQSELEGVVSSLSLGISDLANVIEVWTGIPASDIKSSELADLVGLGERIRSRLVGQEAAVDAVVRALRRKRSGVSYSRSPVSMIFAGPTGVGKTELVKVLSRELFKQPEALIRLDMSEFMEKHSVSRIIGAPPGYVGYDEAGQLTEKIRRRPYSVVLFDEIEKAHPDVLNILLQVLDDGKITDAQGRQVNFENTVIIMTTNAGSEASSAISGFSDGRKNIAADKTEKALSAFLRPEFINRIDEIITFSHLSLADFEEIARIMLGDLTKHMADRGTKISYTDQLVKYIAKSSYSEKYGARNMRRFIEKNVEDKLANLIIDAAGAEIAGIHIDIEDNNVKITSI